MCLVPKREESASYHAVLSPLFSLEFNLLVTFLFGKQGKMARAQMAITDFFLSLKHLEHLKPLEHQKQ